ncbi:hypothetical protein Goarm_021482 [Gossypium armourianum]|uniref:RNase H type-1 domain-containing protein n=1 Tax=Gossypium armourianum TaxID=34283 RepID=A0A7J9IRW4_9ROSI|nr:hypothetical protein [Gossypium armourianum]
MSCSGIVLRDLNSLVLGSKAVLNVNIPAMFAAEALTCVQMIQIGLDLGFTTMKVEGDALSLVKKLQTDNELRMVNNKRSCSLLSNRSENGSMVDGSTRLSRIVVGS